MALVITHNKVSAIADGPDSTQVQPSDWNANHVLTGVASIAQGGTGIASYTVGDLLYASGATTLAVLNDVTAGSYLRSGGAGAAPLWSTLVVPNSATAGDIFVATAGNVMGSLAAAAVGKVLRAAGAGTVAAWSTATFPDTATTTGAYLRADGTNWIMSTLVLPNAATQGDILVATGANTIGSVADVAAGQLLTSGGIGAVPVWSATPSITTLTVATALIIGTNPATVGGLRLANNIGHYTRNATNGADIQVLKVDGSNVINIGDATNAAGVAILNKVRIDGLVQLAGSTSTFPALKRSGTAIQVRLADDSAVGDLTARFKAYTEFLSAISSSAGVLTIDLAVSNNFTTTLTENVTSFTLSNIPATGQVTVFTITITQDGSVSRTVAFTFTGRTLRWPGGVAPVMTPTVGRSDMYTFISYDGGTTFLGLAAGQSL